MELNKDTYLYLTNFADDRTILNMLSVNKKFNDHKFFQQVMERKYPLLIEFKKPEETWKHFFLTMIKCIYKIEETYNIPYYPVKGYNPIDLCNESKQTIINRIMIWAVKDGQMDIVKLMLKLTKGAANFNTYMEYAARYGHMDIVKLMIRKGATLFNGAMSSAAEGGHMDIVKLMIRKGAKYFNTAMQYAANKGHMDIVKLMIEKGAKDFYSAIRYAQLGGQIEMVEFLRNYKR